MTDDKSGALVLIADLNLTGSIRPADPNHVLQLQTVFDDLPPVLVHRPTRLLVDGHMRVAAAQTMGRAQIRVEWLDGDVASVYERAVVINARHGLPLTIGQRRDAAVRLLVLAPSWSDRRIAAAAAIDPKTVARLRRTTQPGTTTAPTRSGEEIPHLGTPPPGGEERHGLDGRRYPTRDALQERRAVARQLLEADPGQSDRSIGRTAGLSAAAVKCLRTTATAAAREYSGASHVPTRPGAPTSHVPCASTPHFAAGGLFEHFENLLAYLIRILRRSRLATRANG